MKHVILSVNDNHNYLYFVPLTCWAWSQFGWHPIIFFNGKESDLSNLALLHQKTSGRVLPLEQSGYRSDTTSQVARLYAACVQGGYLLTSDIDMIPLCDYWKDDSKITVYGHDLTGYRHYPMVIFR